MNLNEETFIEELADIQKNLHNAWFSMILPRGPDHPITIEEWGISQDRVQDCKERLSFLLKLAELDPLTTLLRRVSKYLEEYYRVRTRPVGIPPATVGHPVAVKKEEPKEEG